MIVVGMACLLCGGELDGFIFAMALDKIAFLFGRKKDGLFSLGK